MAALLAVSEKVQAIFNKDKGRGRVAGPEDCQSLARDIEGTQEAGAWLEQACETVGISVRTLQRWKAGHGLVADDGRPGASHPTHALTPAEREGVLGVANEPRHQLECRGVVCRDYDRPSHIV